jgi:2-iminoacetate synthase
MSYYDIYKRHAGLDTGSAFRSVTNADIMTALSGDDITAEEFLRLLSRAASVYLEEMARKAYGITRRYFGKTVQLYTPMYVSNYCDNQCVYCGFNAENDIPRRKLSLEEVEKEAKHIASTGLKHVLLLTGGSREKSPVSYIKDCVGILNKYFSSISIEVYALTEEEYRELIAAGVDGLTIYQEVYDEKIYGQMHPAGPKSDYLFRLEAPERAASAGMRVVNIGVLLGLAPWRKEVFMMGLHAKYLQDMFPAAEIGVSLPRLRPHSGKFEPACKVSDAEMAQMIIALRLFLPRLGITISTREAPALRENLIPLGVTRMSAGSTTAVGGHTLPHEGIESVQFEIDDKRDVEEVKRMLRTKGYQPVLKDWMAV